MVAWKPFGRPASARSFRAAAGSYLKYWAPSPSWSAGTDHSLSAAGTAGFRTPTPSATASMMPLRSMARDMARRTRTSLNGGLSLRK